MGSPKPAITEDEALEALWQTLQACDNELDAKIKSATEGKTLGYIDSVSYSPEDCKLTTMYHTLSYDQSTGEFSLGEAQVNELTHDKPPSHDLQSISHCDNPGNNTVTIQLKFTGEDSQTVDLNVPNASGPKGDKGADVDFKSCSKKTDASTVSISGPWPGSEFVSAGFIGASASANAVSASITGVSLGVKGFSFTVGGLDVNTTAVFAGTYFDDRKSKIVENATNAGRNVAVTFKQVINVSKTKTSPMKQKTSINDIENNALKNEAVIKLK